MENDCDAAGLAEARFGAGQGSKVVFFVTVGTGIGGGLIVDGEIYRGSGSGAAEIGHLRPGLAADRPEMNVESLASGWGIAAAARQRVIELVRTGADDDAAADLRNRCGQQPDAITARIVAQAAADRNSLASDVMARACQALGWAVAQAITLTSPDVVVLGGGVSLAGEALFLAPLRKEVDRYVFPPLLGKFRIAPAELGEQVVVHGALAAAATASPTPPA